MSKVSIPKRSDMELVVWYEYIKPIVEVDGKKYFLREFTLQELKNNSYIWNAENNKTELVDMNQYVPIPDSDFKCLHTFGAFFKPSIAEVLSQIPLKNLATVCAFEIISDDIVYENGFHVSIVRLYTKKN